MSEKNSQSDDSKEKNSINKLKFGNSETQARLSEMIPPSTAEEIMNCDSIEAKGADKWILHFGKVIGNFNKQEELNLAMRILEIANIESIKMDYLSFSHLFQVYCEKYEEPNKNQFKDVLNSITKNSSLSPLSKSNEGLELTKLGAYLLLTYKKLKSETLSMRKYGEFDEVYLLIENIRTYCHFDDYGMEVEVGYSLIYTLRKLVKKLQMKGDLLVKEPKLKKWMNNIYNLIDKLILFQESQDFQEGDLKMKQKVTITNQLIEAIREFFRILHKQFEFEIFDTSRILFDKPFNNMENYILNNTDDWVSKFYGSAYSAIPVQYAMKLNRFYLKKALNNFFDKKKKLTFDELPEDPTSVPEEKEIDLNKIQEKEIHSLKKKLFERGAQLCPCLDYLVIQDKNPVKLVEKSLAFHILAKERKISLNTDFEIIKDEINNIKKISAREFDLYKEEAI
ncbi:MAG: hypothetical protein ACTSR8_13250 [Promethearchaeota archaeon]